MVSQISRPYLFSIQIIFRNSVDFYNIKTKNLIVLRRSQYLDPVPLLGWRGSLSSSSSCSRGPDDLLGSGHSLRHIGIGGGGGGGGEYSLLALRLPVVPEL